MTHRGPDDRGTYTAPGVAFGVRRLSIVDVDGGHQPISDDSGRDLGDAERRALQPSAAPRRASGGRLGLSDTLRHRGDPTPVPATRRVLSRGRCEGCSASPSGTSDERRAVIARDRLGIKPLYYAQAGDLLVFASELKSLLASGLVRPELDFEAIDAYLSLGFVPGPRTPLAGISKAHARPSARRRRERRPDRALLGVPAPRSATVAPTNAGRVGRGAPRPTRRGRAAASDERRPARGDAERRHRLEPGGRAHGAPHGRARANVLRGLPRIRRQQRARRRTLRRERVRHRASRARAVVRRRHRRPRDPHLVHGRAARRPVGARVPRAVRACIAARHRRAFGPGRGRAARRLSEASRGVAVRPPATCSHTGRRCRAGRSSLVAGALAIGRRARRSNTGRAAARDERSRRSRTA